MAKEKKIFSWGKKKGESGNSGTPKEDEGTPKVVEELDLEVEAPVQKTEQISEGVVMSQAQFDALLGRITSSEKKVTDFMTNQTNATNDNVIKQQCTRFGASPEETQELIDSDMTHEEKLGAILDLSHGRVTKMQSAFTNDQGAIGGLGTEDLLQDEKNPKYPKDASAACKLVEQDGVIDNVYKIAKNKYPKAFDRKAQFAAKKAELNKN